MTEATTTTSKEVVMEGLHYLYGNREDPQFLQG